MGDSASVSSLEIPRREWPQQAFNALGSGQRKALATIESLHNIMERQKALETLENLRRRDAAIFHSVPLWLCAQRIVDGSLDGRFRVPLKMRRFLIDLFDGALRSQEALQRLDSM